jgi:hypothetical protein
MNWTRWRGLLWGRQTARYAWPAFALAASLSVIACAATYRIWAQARSSLDVAVAAATSSAAASASVDGPRSRCPDTAAAEEPLLLPGQAAVLNDMRRSPTASAATLADLRFESVAATTTTPRQLHVNATLQGPYAANKEALRSVLERYPGAVLTSLRLQRLPAAQPGGDITMGFTLQFWALPSRALRPSGCAAAAPVALKLGS